MNWPTITPKPGAPDNDAAYESFREDEGVDFFTGETPHDMERRWAMESSDGASEEG